MQWLAERRHPRIEAFLPAQCTTFVLAIPRTRVEGKTRYVSPGGAMLLLPTSLPLHTRLTVRLGEGPEIRGRVVWAGQVFRTNLGMVKGHGIAFNRDLITPVLQQIISGGRRQHHPRMSARFPVAYDHQERVGRGTCLNLSENGMFIGTTNPLCAGQDFLMRVTPPGLRHSLSLSSRVVWTNPLESTNPFPAGMGVRFVDLGSTEAMHLSTVLEQLRSRTAPFGFASA